jgi:hypothetical protein
MARYRCDACGNLTRFEVVETTTTRSLHHFDLGGELAVEDVQLLDATVHSVTCRWCGNGTAVVSLDDGAAPLRT